MNGSFLDQVNHLNAIVSAKELGKNILLIEKTSFSPFVYLNSEDGKIIFKGECRPPDVIEFFHQILDFIESKFKNTKNIEGHFLFEYFNSPSGKQILDIAKILSGLSRSGNNVECYWYYKKEDLDMLVVGEEIMRIVKMPFQFVEVEDDNLYMLKFD
jgi:hypothetical protein